MTQPGVSRIDPSPSDVIDSLMRADGRRDLAPLRDGRPEATTHTQGSYQALFTEPSATAVTRAERLATALRVAALHAESALIDHYAAQLLATGPDSARLVSDTLSGPGAPGLPTRLRAMLVHADLLVIRPGAATPSDLAALQAVGLSAPEIVTVSQVIAFTSFQVRVLIGLTLLRGDERALPTVQIGPRDAPNEGFTLDELGWSPWIVPFEAADATDEQRAVLPGRRLESPYFRLLALDPAVLGERTATDMGIFYTHGGLPRAERELSATVTSRVNGCVYCASVHSRQAAQISKRTDDVQRVLDVGIGAELDDRWRGIVDFAAALTVTPPDATQSHMARLRELGLDDLQILDIAQAAAFFSWANRLMLTLGEPRRPT
ncbi:MAG: alkylhydroperoxidase domain protein [Chloroflexota bacterium]|nr:MAG: alkylhydroperoxidase domain protein [Chloroflexota bacterium]